MRKQIINLILFSMMTGVASAESVSPDFSDHETRQRYLEAASNKIKQDPQDESSYVLRAYIFQFENKLEPALADINKATELNPNDFHAVGLRGQIYCKLKDYRSAVRDFTSAIKLQPSLAYGYNNRAYALLQLNDIGGAERDVRKAIELEPQLADPLETLCEIMFRKGMYSECIRCSNAAIARDAKSSDAFYYRGCAYERLGNKVQGEADKRKAILLGYTGELRTSRYRKPDR